MSLAVGFIRCSMKIRGAAIASAVLATSLAGCGAVDLISSGLKYARAVETDLQQATGVKPAETPPAPIGRFLNFRILLDGGVETGILRFGPASSEGRFAIVTDVGGGM